MGEGQGDEVEKWDREMGQGNGDRKIGKCDREMGTGKWCRDEGVPNRRMTMIDGLFQNSWPTYVCLVCAV